MRKIMVVGSFVYDLLMLTQGVRHGVVITVGSKGAVAVTPESYHHVQSFPVTPVDPTGAGDVFCGAFAVVLLEGKKVEQALRFANASGALVVTNAGIEPSLLTRSEIEAFLNNHA